MSLYLCIELLFLNVAELASCCRSSGEESLAMLAAAKIGISLEESSYDEKNCHCCTVSFLHTLSLSSRLNLFKDWRMAVGLMNSCTSISLQL